MEDLLQAQYNNQLANRAVELYDQRQREQVNNAALGVMQLGFQNQNQMGLAALGDPMSEYNNIDVGGQTFAYDDPMAIEKSNYIDKGFFNLNKNAPGFKGSLARTGISALGRMAGLGTMASSALGFAFAPIAGIAGLFHGLSRSRTIADFLQQKRDKKARDEAAARGARKQGLKAMAPTYHDIGRSRDGGGHAGGAAAAAAAASQASDDAAAGAGGY